MGQHKNGDFVAHGETAAVGIKKQSIECCCCGFDFSFVVFLSFMCDSQQQQKRLNNTNQSIYHLHTKNVTISFLRNPLSNEIGGKGEKL